MPTKIILPFLLQTKQVPIKFLILFSIYNPASTRQIYTAVYYVLSKHRSDDGIIIVLAPFIDSLTLTPLTTTLIMQIFALPFVAPAYCWHGSGC